MNHRVKIIGEDCHFPYIFFQLNMNRKLLLLIMILHLHIYGISYGFPMDFPWISHGFPMDFPWISHGFPMDFLWISHSLTFSRVFFYRPGPCCTQILGDLGAEIIKLERPKVGDDTRGFAPPFLPGAEEVNGWWGLVEGLEDSLW